MTEAEVTALLTSLPGVVVVVASEATGAPEVAWGHSFFFYDPQGDGDHRLPFATIVTSDYPGFDTSSDLSRPGVFRVNLHLDRATTAILFDDPDPDGVDRDFSAFDTLLPHPVHAAQGWVSVVNPGPATDEALARLVRAAHQRAAERHPRG